MHTTPIYIIGAGLAGATLAWQLEAHFGQNVVLIDNCYERNSSLVAAGIFNPITGKRMTKTNMADVLFPYLHTFYTEAEVHLQTKFFYPCSIYKPFDNLAEQNDWLGKSAEPSLKQYIEIYQSDSELNDILKQPYNGIKIKQGGWLDCHAYLKSIKDHFSQKNKYLETKVKWHSGKIIFNKHAYRYHETLINDKKSKIIFCEGWQAIHNPLWLWLPWRLTKGQVFKMEANTQHESILNKGVFVCPTRVSSQYIVGASYIWDRIDNDVEPAITKELVQKLEDYFKPSYRIIEEKSEVRPTVEKREPFIGAHPEFSNFYIFNGFGSKTVSQAPYFSEMFSNYLLKNARLDSFVDIVRYRERYFAQSKPII
jgi:glycine/D-amino acid oxidase-like deaminating enzyme